MCDDGSLQINFYTGNNFTLRGRCRELSVYVVGVFHLYDKGHILCFVNYYPDSTWYFLTDYRKKELLSREDLQLPWRPLYEMLERILYSKTEHLGLNWFPK